MANVIDYIKWRGDINFKTSKFNEVDSLILNRFSYFPLDNLIKKNEIVKVELLYKRLNKIKKIDFLWKEDLELFRLMSISLRFKDIKVCNFINKIELDKEEQFSAVTLILPDNTIYISYRGTDNTIVGWKEDFNMAFLSHLSSQISAKNYLEQTSTYFPLKKIRVGGHSKGGNLAIYASCFAKKRVNKKIINIYNDDGPGFKEEIINTLNYKNTVNRIISFIPQNSIVGLLLEHKEKFIIVKSIEKGIMQHDVYSWIVDVDHFERLNELTNGSKFISVGIKDWLKSKNQLERKKILDIVYKIISTNHKKLEELKDLKIKDAKNILNTYKNVSFEDKVMIINSIKVLLKVVNSKSLGGHIIDKC